MAARAIRGVPALSVLLAIPLFAVLVGACSDSGTDPDGGGGGGGGGPTISLVANAPEPTRVVTRDGFLYWLERSETPLMRIPIASGAPTPVLRRVGYPENAASDGAYLYWIADGDLHRAALDGSAAMVIDQGERERATGVTAAIVMDTDNIYWARTIASGSCSPACTFAVRRVPKSGAPAADVLTTSQPIVGFAVWGDNLFWEEEGTGPVDSAGTLGSQVKTRSISGGSILVLVNGRLNGLIPPPSMGFLPATWHPRGGLLVDDSLVYFSDADFSTSYRVMQVPADGSGSLSVRATVTTGSASNLAKKLVQDASAVYWIDETTVKSIPKGAGAHTDLATGRSSPLGLAVGGSSLYWTETPCCVAGQPSTIERMATAGGAPVVVVAGVNAPLEVAVDPAHLFWTYGGAWGEAAGFGGVSRAGLDGSGVTALVVAAQGGPFDVQGGYEYFADQYTVKRVPVGGGRAEELAFGDFFIRDLASDGTWVYWVEDPISTVRKVPVNGGAIVTLGSGSGPASVLRISANHVYWLDHEDAIRRVPKGGGSSELVVGPVAGFVTDFVVDGANIYYAGWDAGGIWKAPVTGGLAVPLAGGAVDQTRRLATDGTKVYWIDQKAVGSVPIGGGTPTTLATEFETTPYEAAGIAVDATSVFWSEVIGSRLRKAVPK